MRKIIHLDMDCFYAAVEMRERPELAGKPIAVGGGNRRGIVTTCNYEARKFGIHSAMPGFLARARCPHLIFLPVRFELYRADSKRIQAILYEYTPLVETLSLDEAFLDVSASDRYAWDIAKEMRARILTETGLTASAGIAPNKMLAKIASEWKKPNGQFAVLPEQINDFMATLPVRKSWGIGPKSAEKFIVQGIKTCGDLQRFSLAEMIHIHGKWGQELYQLCRGQDNREIHPHRLSKSFSNENTFLDNLTSLEKCTSAIAKIADEMLEDLRIKEPHRHIRKAFIKIKYSDFTRTTKECICLTPNASVYKDLLAQAYTRKNLPIRLLGTGVRFSTEPEHPELFDLYTP